jgi:DNA excision repair protein ERCC-4
MKLPALRSLGELADSEPVIVVDTREQEPLVFTRLPSRIGTLYTGDYSVAGLESLMVIERKSLADLVGCCVGESRERFERELHRARGYRFKRLLVVGSEDDILAGRYRARVSPASVLGTLGAFEARYDIPVTWCPTPEVAARQIERWAFYFAREMVEAVNGLRRSLMAEGDTSSVVAVSP